MSKLALAFDLGGTALRGALVESDGRIVAHASAPTLAGAGSEAVIGQIIALAGDLIAQSPQAEIAGSASVRRGRWTPRRGS